MIRANTNHEWERYREARSKGGWPTFRCTRCGRRQVAPTIHDLPDQFCTGISSRQRLRSRSPSNKRKRKDRGLDSPLKQFILRQRCMLWPWAGEHRCKGDVVAHHVAHKNRAGDWIEVGSYEYGNLVPVCWRAHTEIHEDGKHTFERRYGTQLAEWARAYGQAFCTEVGHDEHR